MEAAEELKAREDELLKLTSRLEEMENKIRVTSDEAQASALASERFRSQATEYALAIEKLQQEVGRLLDVDSSHDLSEGEPDQFVLKKEKVRALRSAPAPQAVSTTSRSPQRSVAISAAPDLSQVAGNIKSLKQEIALKTSELQQKDHDLVSLKSELEECKNAYEKSRKESAEYVSFLESEVDSAKVSLAQAAEGLKTFEENAVRHQLELDAKQQEIKDVTSQLDEMVSTLKMSKQEASEYATHLEGEVEATQASLLEAAEELKLREEQAASHEQQISEVTAELKRVQESMEKARREVISCCTVHCIRLIPTNALPENNSSLK